MAGPEQGVRSQKSVGWKDEVGRMHEPQNAPLFLLMAADL